MAEDKKKGSGRVRAFALSGKDVTAIGIAFIAFAQNPCCKEEFRENAKRKLKEVGLSESEDTAIEVVESCLSNIIDHFTKDLAKGVSDRLEDFIEVLEELRTRSGGCEHKA